MIQKAEQAKLTMINVHVNKAFDINIIFNASVVSIGMYASMEVAGLRSFMFMVMQWVVGVGGGGLWWCCWIWMGGLSNNLLPPFSFAKIREAKMAGRAV